MYGKGTFVDTSTRKPWYLSKTIWVNLLVFVLSILYAISNDGGVKFEYLATVSAVVNVILRFVTTDPIGLFDDEG